MTAPPPYGAYPPPQGGYPTEYYGYPRPRATNAMAIASLVCAFLFAPLGIVFGHISLSQIKRTGEDGRGLAIAGLVISYLATALAVVVVASAAGGSGGSLFRKVSGGEFFSTLCSADFFAVDSVCGAAVGDG